MARPRTRSGKISENMAHITGPREIAKPAMKRQMARRTRVPLIERAFLARSWAWPESAAPSSVGRVEAASSSAHTKLRWSPNSWPVTPSSAAWVDSPSEAATSGVRV